MSAPNKKMNIAYWIITVLVLLPTAGSGIAELIGKAPEQTIKSLQLLGYPLYIMKILGTAKLLGAIAILSGKHKTLKEWAYAGFTFNFLGATASHVLAGDSANAPMPMIFLILLLVSYFLNLKRGES